MAEEIENSISNLLESKHLYEDVCHIIDDTRTRVAVYVNSEVCMTNWRIGTRIKEDVLFNKRRIWQAGNKESVIAANRTLWQRMEREDVATLSP